MLYKLAESIIFELVAIYLDDLLFSFFLILASLGLNFGNTLKTLSLALQYLQQVEFFFYLSFEACAIEKEKILKPMSCLCWNAFYRCACPL